MKTIISLANTLILLMAVTIFSSNLKEYIPIVKPNIYDSTTQTLIEIAKYLENKNYPTLGAIFRSYAEGGHGSGFVTRDGLGNTYIITNKHVVKHGMSTTITFKNQNNVNTTYENAEILYVDDVLDLAVIDVKLNKGNSVNNLILTTKPLADGVEVWSVGYPGLLGRPGWQFTKGIITNSRAYVHEIMDTSISFLIQHSASIDPGNSGGPLLVKESGAGALGYKVAGVNTWVIRGRQNTFFAIPSSQIKVIIDKANGIKKMRNNHVKKMNLLDKTCKKLASELNSTRSKLSKTKNYISYKFVGTSGWSSYLYIIDRLSTEERAEWNSLFFESSPVETMRRAVFARVQKMFKSDNNDVAFVDINFADKSASKNIVRTNYKVGEKKIEISWVFEFGHWRISHVDLEQNKESTVRVVKAASSTSRSAPGDAVIPERSLDTTTGYREGPPAGINLLLPGCSQYRYKNKFLAALLTTTFATGFLMTTVNEISFQRNWKNYEEEFDPAKTTELYNKCLTNRNRSITGISLIGASALISFLIELID